MENLRPFAERAQHIFDTIDWLKRDYGLGVNENAPLGKILQYTRRELAACKPTNASASGILTLAQTRAIRGLDGLCARFVRAKDTQPIPKQFGKWIKQMGVGIPSLCSPKSDFPTPGDNKELKRVEKACSDILELAVGLAALEMGRNVLLEREGHSKPDVRVEIDGEIWGIACKVSNSTSPIRHFNIISEAAEKALPQLEAGLADRAIIVLCAQNIFSREPLTMLNHDEARNSLKRRTLEFVENVRQANDENKIIDKIINIDDRILPGAIIYYEDVFEMGTFREVALPGEPPGALIRLIYAPYTYSQYVTFGDRGLALEGIPQKLAKTLAGPNSEEMGSIYNTD